jgi:hydrogenase expression/formation protein HypD
MFEFRDKKMAQKIISKLKAYDLDITIMHVCGTHQDTLVRHGLQMMLSDVGVDIRQGPGCPVCVTTPKEIEEGMAMARAGKTIAVFGDMMKVPGLHGSLSDLRNQGLDIQIVYSITDAVKYASSTGKETVFMGIGFETTIPSTASVIIKKPPENFSILCSHRTVPNALKAIIEMGEVKLQGLIEPGHVSTIIGMKPYKFISEKYHMPQVIAGFEPLDLLMGVFMLAKQITSGRALVENEYKRVVHEEGNQKAIGMLEQVFQPCDVPWRGFPVIPESGLKLRTEFDSYDARLKFPEVLEEINKIEYKEPPGCRCGEVLRGIIDSTECPLFGTGCTPENPIGPCMVSSEGSCNILHKYGKHVFQ